MPQYPQQHNRLWEVVLPACADDNAPLIRRLQATDRQAHLGFLQVGLEQFVNSLQPPIDAPYKHKLDSVWLAGR